MAGTFHTARGEAGRPFRFTYRPTACGVAIEFRARAGEDYEYSAFLPSHRRLPNVRGRTVSGGAYRVSFNLPGAVRLERGYASSSEPWLVRARIRLHPAKTDIARVTLCGAPLP